MKTVIIGCGGIARSAHAPAMARYRETHAGYQIAACCDLDAERARSLAQDFEIPRWYTDLDEMLTLEEPDAAISLVDYTVARVVVTHLFERGIPTMLEKPPGRNIDDAMALLEAANRTRTPHMVAFNRRFMPLYDRAKEQLEGQKIRHIRYFISRVRRFDPDFSTTAIHALDTVRHITGSEYEYLDNRYQALPEHGPSVANFFMNGATQSGAEVSIGIVVSTGEHSEGCDIYTDARTIHARCAFPAFSDERSYLRVYDNDELALALSGGQIDPSGQSSVSNGFYAEHERFYACLAKGITPPSQLCDALQSVAAGDALRARKPRFTP